MKYFTLYFDTFKYKVFNIKYLINYAFFDIP